VDEKIYDVIRDDPRYPLEAYEFVCDTVEFTQQMLGRAPREEDDPDTDYHVTGGELVRGACELAVQEFGLMAPVVFKMWNIRRTDDVGNIVFNLIRAEQLSQSDRDDPDDFRDLFDIPKALADGFQMTTVRPSKKKGTR
jgi:uncharacterized repeat protein (TIGR04138 family)